MQSFHRVIALSAALLLAPLAASAHLDSMDDGQLRAVSGQAGAPLPIIPPPVQKLHKLANTLDQYGFPKAAGVVNQEAALLFIILRTPCNGPVCTFNPIKNR
jgi:hypothetical protein